MTVAVVAENLPSFEPPVGGNGFRVPYAERLSASLVVEPSDTLAAIYARAIDELQPRAVADSQGYVDDPLDAVRWVWFYEPADEDGIDTTSKAWEVAEDLIVVDADGTARWNRTADQVTVSELVRASEWGLLRGDPLRPYLMLLRPQGGEAFQTAWDATVLIWEIAAQLLTARELIKLARGVHRKRAERKISEGLAVIEVHRDTWSQTGGGPSEVLRLLERRPWPLEDLRILLGLDNEDDAAKLLQLYGFEPDSHGVYALSEDEESQILHLIGQEAGFGGFWLEEPDSRGQQRLAAVLETGELPPRFGWPEDD